MRPKTLARLVDPESYSTATREVASPPTSLTKTDSSLLSYVAKVTIGVARLRSVSSRFSAARANLLPLDAIFKASEWPFTTALLLLRRPL